MITASQIAEFLDAELAGGDIDVSSVCTADAPEAGGLLFVKKPLRELTDKINRCRGCFVITTEDASQQLVNVSRVSVERPRLAFAKVLNRFFRKPRAAGIAATAVVSPEAVIHPSVSIGEFTVIDAQVQIGKNTVVGNHVVLKGAVKLGDDCVIDSHAVIGHDGFGYEIDDDGIPIHIPHFGGVVIGNGVAIGAGTIVARGTIQDTVIGDNVKIDIGTHIAHNVTIGKNTIITGGVNVSGSSKVGSGVWIAPGADILNKTLIEDGAMVGIGSVVVRRVKQGKLVLGNPAKAVCDRL